MVLMVYLQITEPLKNRDITWFAHSPDFTTGTISSLGALRPTEERIRVEVAHIPVLMLRNVMSN